MKESILIVTGMHRSGTSLTASLLQSAGLDVGERLMGVDKGNDKGHFENLDFVELHQNILSSIETSIAGWTLENKIYPPQEYVEKAKELVAKNSLKDIWGWKDPRTTLFLDFWADLLPEANFLFVYRSPSEVVDSLYRRGDEIFYENPTFPIELWMHYNKNILDFYHKHSDKCLILNIDSITKDPKVLLKAIEKKFNIVLKHLNETIYEEKLLKSLNKRHSNPIRYFYPEAFEIYSELQKKDYIANDAHLYPFNVDFDSVKKIYFKNWLEFRWKETKLEQSQSQLQEKQAELELSQKEIVQIQTELEQSRSQIEDKQAQLKKSQSQIEDKQAQLELSQSELQQSQKQLQQSQLELQQIQTQLHQAHLQLQQSQTLIAAIQTSKFWQLRRVWFKFRNAVGIKDEAKSLLAIPQHRKNQIEKLKWTWKQQGARGTVSFLQKYIRNKVKQRTSYQQWINENRLNKLDIIKAKRQIEKFALKPKFSVIVPVYNVEQKWLEKAIESVRNQVYPYWELCIADDASPKPHIRSVLTKYSKLDSRIKVAFREQNANISAASNSALELATGEYIALLDHDDELAINALFENAKLINLHPDADFIYSDEDKIDTSGNRLDPFFKPDWSPEYFHSCMYTCHLGVYRRSIIQEIGGFRSKYDGSQDYDLVLRVVEKTQNIYHIPKILYHWRIIPASVTSGEEAKPWAYIAARKALEAMLERSPYSGRVEETTRAGFWRVRRDIVGEPLISIVIPSGGTIKDTPKGSLCLLENCINSIQNLTSYRKFEIVVVDGYDIPQPTLDKIVNNNVELVRCSKPFNFSMRINIGAAKAKGEFLLLLNDDTEVITPDWLESMLELAQQKEIGAVGAKLFYPNGKLQHAGVMVLGGNPGHAFHGMDGDHPGYFCSNIVNRNYIGVTAACLMMRKEVFDKLGGLDESFPLNYNDVDLCLKAHKAGYRNVVTPYVQLIHYESASRGEGLRPGEWEQLNNRWNSYLESLNGDPFYNSNLSCKNANFELF